MDATVTKRRNRFSSEPIYLPDGRLYEREPTEKDDEILESLAKIELMTIQGIAATTGRPPDSVKRSLRQMKASQLIKNPIWQTENQKEHWFYKCAYELADAGIVRMKDKGIPVIRGECSGQGLHRMMTCEWILNTYLSLRNTGARYIPYHEMVLDPRMPEAGLEKHKPWRFELEHDGKAIVHCLDTRPAIIDPGPDQKFKFIVGVEIDRGTEPQTTIDKKVREQIYLLESGILKQRFGFPKGSIIYINGSRTRLNNIKERVAKATESNPDLRRWFLFNTQPDSKENLPPRTDMLVYERIQYPSLSLVK